MGFFFLQLVVEVIIIIIIITATSKRDAKTNANKTHDVLINNNK